MGGRRLHLLVFLNKTMCRIARIWAGILWSLAALEHECYVYGLVIDALVIGCVGLGMDDEPDFYLCTDALASVFFRGLLGMDALSW